MTTVQKKMLEKNKVTWKNVLLLKRTYKLRKRKKKKEKKKTSSGMKKKIEYVLFLVL